MCTDSAYVMQCSTQWLTRAGCWLHPILVVTWAQQGTVLFRKHKAVSGLEFAIALVAAQTTCMECLSAQKEVRYSRRHSYDASLNLFHLKWMDATVSVHRMLTHFPIYVVHKSIPIVDPLLATLTLNSKLPARQSYILPLSVTWSHDLCTVCALALDQPHSSMLKLNLLLLCFDCGLHMRIGAYVQYVFW